MASTTFSSDGFDLDAIPNSEELAGDESEGGDNIVYEIGGGASKVDATEREEQNKKEEEAGAASPTFRSEEFKARGNEEFKAGNYLDAYDMYTDAIEACPGIKGSEILKMKDEFEEREREKAYERHRRSEEQRRRKSRQRINEDEGTATKETEESESDTEKDDSSKPVTFECPPHEHGSKLSIYHCNRAACLLHLGRYDEAIADCDIAILLNPSYVKAYIRRMQAYESTDQTEEALRDAKKAMELDPTNPTIRKNVSRLQKLEDERLEKLKEETMGKLKDLGNTILGKFGLSLDNFKAEQDPKTGSYNISFQQNK